MFRKVAECFQNQVTPAMSPSESLHAQFVEDQDKHFGNMPNMILSHTSGLRGFSDGINTLSPVTKKLETPIRDADNIFYESDPTALAEAQRYCANNSLDELIRTKNKSDITGCGWKYTPPKNGSTQPQFSRGGYGTRDGPFQNTDTYSKWFYDLDEAKRTMSFDLCKQLKSCSRVEDPAFKDKCGYCTDINQGIPIDRNGAPLYPNVRFGNCSPGSIITSKTKCPVPASVSGISSGAVGPGVGVVPVTVDICEPVDGKLTRTCLMSKLREGGCSDNGALALALSNNPRNVDKFIQSDALKKYNQLSTPALDYNIFIQGRGTAMQALNEVRNLSSVIPQHKDTSAIGAAARDLCLNVGDFAKYNFCLDLKDTDTGPYELKCLQDLFLLEGGQPGGAAFPRENNRQAWDNMANVGAIKNYIRLLKNNTNSRDYNVQRQAMIDFLGIRPELAITRVPFINKVEVFWFTVYPTDWDNRNRTMSLITSFLKRTLEDDIPNFPVSDVSPIKQIGFTEFSAFLALTDVRMKQNTSTQFRVTSDDGFWIALNQPQQFDKFSRQNRDMDIPGYFTKNLLQAPTTYNSGSQTQLSGKFPNIMKLFWNDSAGGGHTMLLSYSNPEIKKQNYSLTCEARAPFMNFEVNTNVRPAPDFEETRNPISFATLVGRNNLQFGVQSEEMNNTPGKKPFAKLNNQNSSIILNNIAYQSWKTMTCAIRLQTRATGVDAKDTIFYFTTGNSYLSIYAVAEGSNTARLFVRTNITPNRNETTTRLESILEVGKWCLVTVTNLESGFSVSCEAMNTLLQNGGRRLNTSFRANGNVYPYNGVNLNLRGINNVACRISVGTKDIGTMPGVFSTNAVNYDVAWLHFFDTNVSDADIVRECNADWRYTQFPESYGVYRTQ